MTALELGWLVLGIVIGAGAIAIVAAILVTRYGPRQ